MLLDALQWGLSCAVIGVVYAEVLANESTPLSPWFDFLHWMDARGKQWSWLAKPMGACEKCASGQLALWTSWAFLQFECNAVAVAFCLLSAGTAILSAPLLTKLYRWSQG